MQMAALEDLDPGRDPADIIRALTRLRRDPGSVDPRHILALLDHSAPDVRVAALGLLFVEWRVALHRSRATSMLREDPNDEVRAAAAYATVATSSEGTRSSDVGVLLASVESDPSPEVRRAAYEGLLLTFQRPDFPDALKDFNPSVDIDWEWIQELKILWT